MPAQGRNERYHMLADFVCEAIPAPGIPTVAPGRARIQDTIMMEELIHDAGAKSADPLYAAMKAEAVRVAALLATAPDPKAAAGAFQKLLLAEIAGHRL